MDHVMGRCACNAIMPELSGQGHGGVILRSTTWGYGNRETGSMDIQIARIFIAVAVPVILWSGANYLLAYLLVFHASIEFLNSRRVFQEVPEHRRYNAIFIGFVLFIVLNRARAFRFDERVEFILNLAEHGLFALVICLNLLCYLDLLGRWAHRARMLVVVLLFNVIGLVNEAFQNAMNDRILWFLEPDAIKDIAMNVAGSVIFLLLVRGRSDLPRSMDVV
jgi:hypothetical protein